MASSLQGPLKPDSKNRDQLIKSTVKLEQKVPVTLCINYLYASFFKRSICR